MIKKLTAIVVLLVTTFTMAQEKVLLRVKYEKGAHYTMSMNMKQIMGMGLMTQDMSMETKYFIENVSGEEYDATAKFTRMAMDMSQGGMKVSYDSSKKDEELDENGKMMKVKMQPMLDAVITLKGNSMGEILEIKMEPNVAGMGDMKDNAGTIPYPKEEVTIGDTWTNSKISNGLSMNYVYTVNSITKEKVILGVSGKVSGPGEGTITGTIDVDRKSGIPEKSNIEMAIKIQGQDLSTNVTTSFTKD